MEEFTSHKTNHHANRCDDKSQKVINTHNHCYNHDRTKEKLKGSYPVNHRNLIQYVLFNH
ncbi:IS3 family transposase [Moraxella bovoculi]|uniref:IS3 family transposase n=1 Tax=Moraxella bovoculi TaxID=386891 RepID=UPI003872D99B